MGHHVADYHAVAVFFQPLQRFRSLICPVYGQYIKLVAQQIAQCMGRLRNAGKTDDGIAVRIILSQLHGAQHIIYGKLNLHYRQICHLADQLCRAAAGNNTVIGIRGHTLYNGNSHVQIPGKNVKLYIRIRGSRPIHGSMHPLVGGNP